MIKTKICSICGASYVPEHKVQPCCKECMGIKAPRQGYGLSYAINKHKKEVTNKNGK